MINCLIFMYALKYDGSILTHSTLAERNCDKSIPANTIWTKDCKELKCRWTWGGNELIKQIYAMSCKPHYITNMVGTFHL